MSFYWTIILLTLDVPMNRLISFSWHQLFPRRSPPPPSPAPAPRCSPLAAAVFIAFTGQFFFDKRAAGTPVESDFARSCRAIELNPGNHILYANRAFAHIKQENYGDNIP